ncbi:sialate O-acetylesterase [Aridibaculum aurantiacum]|uniref:sialate O-acetylesterase n=1 Tax=Aridibaculum aurantiacum TaxID=2810307 RepID=UPI001A96BE37|nr:sialate O-acetylesterase [Aridibaculum aurantiacum]
MVRIILAFFLLTISCVAHGQVRLPQIIRDSMILQRDTKVNVWGWASAGEKVTVTIASKKYRTTTDHAGKWKVMVGPVKAGGPYEMEIAGKNKIRLSNILFGDVWFCSGQSNMVHQMELHKETYASDIANANNDQIRHFIVPNKTNLQAPEDNLTGGSWKTANPTDVRQFSAVAYFFATTIYDKYKIPIGLINASVGGTPIEAWTSEEGFKEFPAVLNTVHKNRDTAYINSYNRNAAATQPKGLGSKDLGMKAATKWYDPNYLPKGWSNINIPGYWEDQGTKNLDGVVWYRKEIEVPGTMAGKAAKLTLGRIVDADVVYVNGTQVGSTGYQYPQRRYAIPAGLLKAGKNLVVVRVVNYGGKGGFVPDKPYHFSAGTDTIDLKGTWQYKVGEVFTPAKNVVEPINLQNQPTALYNAMVAPLTNYNIKGVLWYQGESNIRNAADYAKLLPNLIDDWRTKWKQPSLPFIYAQLPNFQEVQYLPSESDLAVMRESQLKALSVPNTGMAVTIELGEWNDIHPDNKKDVGVRMAQSALKVAYGEQVIPSGPIFKSFTRNGNKLVLSFDHIGSGLISKDGEPLRWFAIAGADKKFVWANAEIQNDTVVVWNEEINDPKYVRYAWADNPADVNFYNKEGLPASPFRTGE